MAGVIAVGLVSVTVKSYTVHRGFRWACKQATVQIGGARDPPIIDPPI